jgi:hypothetical protein
MKDSFVVNDDEDSASKDGTVELVYSLIARAKKLRTNAQADCILLMQLLCLKPIQVTQHSAFTYSD